MGEEGTTEGLRAVPVNIKYKRTNEINGHQVSNNSRTYEVWTQENKNAEWVMRGWVDGGTINQSNGPRPWMMLTKEAAKDSVCGRWSRGMSTRDEAVEWALQV